MFTSHLKIFVWEYVLWLPVLFCDLNSYANTSVKNKTKNYHRFFFTCVERAGLVCSVAQAPWKCSACPRSAAGSGVWRHVLPGTYSTCPNAPTGWVGCWETHMPVSGMAGTMSVTLGGTGFIRIFCGMFCKSCLNVCRCESTNLYGTISPQLNDKSLS